MDKMFQAALFDLDGVVLDTESQYTTFWAGVFERYYGDGETYAQKIKGQTLTQIYHAYFDGDQQRQQLITSQLVDFEHNMGFPYIPWLRSLCHLSACLGRTHGHCHQFGERQDGECLSSPSRTHPLLRPHPNGRRFPPIQARSRLLSAGRKSPRCSPSRLCSLRGQHQRTA